MNILFSFLAKVATALKPQNYIFTYEEVFGIGEEAGISRRDPSDIFKIGDTYYVYYSYNTFHPTGYYSTVYLAKSTDTINWTEIGEAIPKGGVGEWDEQATFTPNVIILNDKIYVYYESTPVPYTSDPYTNTGVAWQNVADIETFPYTKSVNNPILEPSTTASDFDSRVVADPQMILQGDQIYMYYKGRKIGETSAQTRHGLAISDDPLANFIKYTGNPIYNSGHEVLIFRYGNKLRSIIDEQGFDPSLHNSVLESTYGKTGWTKIQDIEGGTIPFAASYYRDDNFIKQYNSKGLTWGLRTLYGGDGLPYLTKFTVT